MYVDDDDAGAGHHVNSPRWSERRCPFCGLWGAYFDVMPRMGGGWEMAVFCPACNMCMAAATVEFAMLPLGRMLQRLEHQAGAP
jgi:hypothetical protein